MDHQIENPTQQAALPGGQVSIVLEYVQTQVKLTYEELCRDKPPMGKALRMAESFVPPDNLFDFLEWCESIKPDAQDEWSDPLEASLEGGNKSMEQMREGVYGMVAAKLAWARAWNQSLPKEKQIERCLQAAEMDFNQTIKGDKL